MDIHIDLLNRCAGPDVPTIVVFQRADGDLGDGLAVAWKVIRNCAPGWHHPFTFSTALDVDVSDMNGNHLPALAAGAGKVFEVAPLIAGRRFGCTQHSVEGQHVDVRNALRRCAVHANLYSNGALLARRDIAPGSRARFDLHTHVWIGMGEAREGQRFDPDAIEGAVQVSLRGIASAALVLTDDGVDESFRIKLGQVVRT
jgi:hypothetical protein